MEHARILERQENFVGVAHLGGSTLIWPRLGGMHWLGLGLRVLITLEALNQGLEGKHIRFIALHRL